MLNTIILIGLLVLAWQRAKDVDLKEARRSPLNEIWKGLTGTELY